jgi:hypothetical protein
MCNAAKHSSGCACGFGPPYAGVVTVAGVTQWAEEAVDRPSIVQPALATAGWDEEGIARFLASFNDIRGARLPRETRIDRINELLGLRRVLVRETVEDWIKVPLYRFGAPPVKGAVVSYTEADSSTEESGWSLKVLGIGTGASTELKVAQTRKFVAEHGTCKQVFVKVKLRVEHIAVYEGVRHVGNGIRANVAIPKKKNPDLALRGRGCDTLVTELCRSGEADDRDNPLDFFFAGDASGVIHTDERSWEINVAKEVSTKLEKLLNVGTLVKVKRLRRLALEFKLPAGHDYSGFMGKGALWWEKP